MAKPNIPPHLSTHQNRNCQKPFCSPSLQIVGPLAVHTRIGLPLVANHRTRREKQFLNYCILFPKQRVLRERMLRVRPTNFPPSTNERKMNESAKFMK